MYAQLFNSHISRVVCANWKIVSESCEIIFKKQFITSKHIVRVRVSENCFIIMVHLFSDEIESVPQGRFVELSQNIFRRHFGSLIEFYSAYSCRKNFCEFKNEINHTGRTCIFFKRHYLLLFIFSMLSRQSSQLKLKKSLLRCMRQYWTIIIGSQKGTNCLLSKNDSQRNPTWW